MDDPIGRAIENAQNAIDEAQAEITRLRAALDAMTAERDAARAHNANLSASMEGRVRVARVKALEDAAEVADSEGSFKVADAIRAMIEQEDKG